MKKKFLVLILCATMFLPLTACDDSAGYLLENNQQINNNTNNENNKVNEQSQITYLAMLYDNQGNNFLNFEGKNFEITPNKIKQWGYNTNGTWTSYYDTSSVVTINIDNGNYIESCGSTVIFKDTRLEMLDISKVLDTANNETSNNSNTSKNNKTGYSTADDYFGLKYWWYEQKEAGQHGSKIVLIQSQDGYNIGAFTGNDITWSVAEKLPKTTQITIDNKELYIHRCNFTIIDTSLLSE